MTWRRKPAGVDMERNYVIVALWTFQDVEAERCDVELEGSAADGELHLCQYRSCGASFQHKRSLARHQRQKHGALFGVAHQMAFFCGIDDCQRVFYAKATLITHQKTVHGFTSDELQ